MKKTAKIILELSNGILAMLIMLSPFVIPSVADGDPLQNTIPFTCFIYFYGLWTGLWFSKVWSSDTDSLTEKEVKIRECLLHYYPLWSIPIYMAIYWAAFTLR